ncbi:selenoprotein S [Erythrolamprus reginae]|uniref:selenoprotein S n=1 Tax=Erythrolamprus reginae TaxID=121349 RepID=UPI00396CE69A
MAGNVAPDPQGPPAGQEGAQFFLQAVSALFSDYGWYILFGLIAIYLLVQKLSKNLQGPKESSVPISTIEPDDVVKQQEALLAARMKMQEQLNVQAEKFKEKQKLLEEEKRKQKIAMWESMQEGKSYKATVQHNQEPMSQASTSTTAVKPKPNKKPLRGEGYNPLSGEGGGTCSWRPGRRGPSSGG